MLFTVYKEIQIGFGKLHNQYKQKTGKIWNMTIFEKISGILEISGILASLIYTHMIFQWSKGIVSKKINM